ncbi:MULTISPECIES: phytanoyl-CoA dioxygenase family protein [Olivibacter]|uniref:Phytanoyl-CoA dioxygenase family protein n=1 Tax=Olivibacter jilunii TaxID=985016 RepID=A0ABW6B2K4_9SPHI|nr:phytanoyl-CoA dioxygenase family protein [Olivibacter sp. UJ_SKK_5.1]MDX3916577.1 phytanoyl-CoA dioxygenase family protein [Pseudosphingobacterium sp.]
MTAKEQFEQDGYLIIDVLSQQEIDDFRMLMDELISPKIKADDSPARTAAFQHLGDELSDFGKEARQYYFHLLTKPGTESIHHAFHHPVILDTVEKLIGPNLIINNASILAANEGTSYSLGWHRDVIQIPQNEIEDWLFSPQRFHNSVQINLPLVAENSLWIVPGSHNRPNTEAEKVAFGGSKHYAPVGAEMPGGIPVTLKAGQAVLYNNNLIHRGYTEKMNVPRRTLHMGYHSANYPPTWHFYLLNANLLTPDYLKRLTPTMREMMQEYLDCRQRYPNMEDTWKWEYNFPDSPLTYQPTI